MTSPTYGWTRRALLAALLALVPALAPAPALLAQADSTSSNVKLFTYRDAVLAGSVFVSTILAHNLDVHYAARLQDSSTQANRKLHKLSSFVRTVAAPGALVIGTSMYAVGRIGGNEKLAELGLYGTEALLLGELSGGIIKDVVGRQRPSVRPQNVRSVQLFRGLHDGDDYRSFPSGHTIAAFAAAAAVTSVTSRFSPDTRWVVGPAMFGGAALVGLSRMYDNRHWASDVIAGAGIGTFAGLKVVRFQHAHPGNRIDRIFLSGSLSPNEAGGQSLRWSVLPGSLLGQRTR